MEMIHNRRSDYAMTFGRGSTPMSQALDETVASWLERQRVAAA